VIILSIIYISLSFNTRGIDIIVEFMIIDHDHVRSFFLVLK
jgi:hypothetical protein